MAAKYIEMTAKYIEPGPDMTRFKVGRRRSARMAREADRLMFSWLFVRHRTISTSRKDRVRGRESLT